MDTLSLTHWHTHTHRSSGKGTFPGARLSLNRKTPIAAVFYEYVETLVYSHSQTDKMLVLDDDGELFAALINKPVPASEESGDLTDIVVQDIVGSKFAADEQSEKQ